MARGSTPALPDRRPLLGLLWLSLALLVLGSLVSSPPWTGEPLLPGVPPDACGMVGRVTADVLFGYFGVPLSIPIVTLLFVIGARALLRRPRRPWWMLLWMGATAASFSVFAASAMPLQIWGSGPRDLAAVLGSPDMLGPLGAVIVSGALFAVLWFFGVPRLLPSPLAGWSMEMGQRALEWMAEAGGRLRELAMAAGSLIYGRIRRSASDAGLRSKAPSGEREKHASPRAKSGKTAAKAPVESESGGDGEGYEEDEEDDAEAEDGEGAEEIEDSSWEEPVASSRADRLRQLQGPKIAERPTRERPARPARL